MQSSSSSSSASANKFFNAYLLIGLIPLLILTNVFMFIASFRDPGFIPQNESRLGQASAIPFKEYQGRLNPMTGLISKLEVGFPAGSFMFNYKYCIEDNIYRPPRAAHCYICMHCVERFDHHCPWIGVCIGKKNYFWFVVYIFTKSAFLLFVLGVSIYGIVKAVQNEQKYSEGFRVFLIVIFSVLTLASAGVS